MRKDIFWAKKKDGDNGLIKWLPLRQHLLDTAFIMDRLWEFWIDLGQKKVIEQALCGGDKDPKKLVRFIGLTHDIAKATYCFQIGKNKFNPVNTEILEKLEREGFKVISEKTLLANPNDTPHAKAGQAILMLYGVNIDVATIIGSHHGKPINKDEEGSVKRMMSTYPRNFYQSDRDDGLSSLWKSAQKDLLDWALEEAGYKELSDIPKIKQKGQILLSGLLIMSDWIASNEIYFPLVDVFDEEVSNKDDRYKLAWSKWQQSDVWNPKNIDINGIYKRRFQIKEVRKEQEKFSHIVENTYDPGLFIFEAPMGLGKTEAALVAVEQLAYKCDKSGMFFGLPTQATSNGIFPRIENWLENMAVDNLDRYSIRLSHGKANLNDDFSMLKYKESHAESINLDGDKYESLLVNEWFSGRKTTSLDDFVVGTVDQFLMLALKQKHLALRHLGFSRKVIVIDEVHAYDVYSSQYLKRAIEWAGTYNLPVIMLSATLPFSKRQELVESYLIGKGIKKSEIIRENIDIETAAYPLITYTSGNEIRQFKDFEKRENKIVEIIKIDSEEIFDIVDEMSKFEGVIGIIVNTVKKSQELAEKFSLLYGVDNVELLHSSFIAPHRVIKEKKLLSMIGKNSKRPNFKIIIGTQVMEQSLDIDFDVLISDLCPMDLLLQRLGRLHRDNERKIPFMHKEPKLYIMGTSDDLDFEEGSEAIYGGYILSRTMKFLPETIKIPRDISKLVQKVYSDDEIHFSNSLQEKYNDFFTEYESLIDTKKHKAKAFILKKPSNLSEGKMIGWLDDTPGEVSWNNNEENGKSQVRDIQATIEVIALKKVGGGYGLFDENVDISDSILENMKDKEVSKYTLRLPLILSMGYYIDRTINELENFNSNYLNSWRESKWLRGALGIIFDENNTFNLGGYVLKYDTKYGLTYGRRKSGKI